MGRAPRLRTKGQMDSPLASAQRYRCFHLHVPALGVLSLARPEPRCLARLLLPSAYPMHSGGVFKGFAGWFAKLYGQPAPQTNTFDDALIPTHSDTATADRNQEQLQKLQEQLQ